ncbi:putative coatomer subunit zeta [Tritrichomonas foetus]|uniref:Coatomer subunit zeta n=1 Tax=Tritrichomonas foetus TaxID=1144522 RepID=A0A1J4L1F4_9EUKA|nr:putative coatomer subunit zeta [Tritrichomonas foetus]|eukprot:OHT17351.1 putative coatomer subunit zeta [Tritrichomonas foetus]
MVTFIFKHSTELSLFSSIIKMGWEDLTKISAFIIYSDSDQKIFSQYYDAHIPESRREIFEKNLNDKVRDDQSLQSESSVFQIDNSIVVFRTISDIRVFVVGNMKTNELLFDELISTFSTVLELIYGRIASDLIKSKIDSLYLIIDDMIDQGFIFEGDPEVIASRVSLKDDGAFTGRAINHNTHF